MPRPVLGALGLLGQPAHCQISVPATEAGLLTVTLGDIQNVPISAEVNLGNSPHACRALKNNSAPASWLLQLGWFRDWAGRLGYTCRDPIDQALRRGKCIVGDLAMIMIYWTQTDISENPKYSRRFRRDNDTFS